MLLLWRLIQIAGTVPIGNFNVDWILKCHIQSGRYLLSRVTPKPHSPSSLTSPFRNLRDFLWYVIEMSFQQIKAIYL